MWSRWPWWASRSVCCAEAHQAKQTQPRMHHLHRCPVSRSGIFDARSCLLLLLYYKWPIIHYSWFLFVWVFRPIWEFFTHMEMWPLLVKDCKFWRTLDTSSHWAVRVSLSMPHLLWHLAWIYNGYMRGTVTVIPIVKRLAVELSLTVLMT